MGKTYRKDPRDYDDYTMDLFDKLASQYARKIESTKSKI